MDYFWFSIVLMILVIVIIFGSLRQYRVKKILTDTQQIIKEMIGGRSGRGSGGRGSGGRGSGGRGSSGRGSSGRGSGGHDRGGHDRGGHGKGGHGRIDRGRDHRGYIDGRHYRYYGDPYLGSYGGWGWDWGRGWDWPYWTRWNWWWPNYDTCIDYARNSCVGATDYQSCYDVEYRNCPYIYY